MAKKRFPFYQQLDHMDCGPTCLRMVAKYYGKSYSLQFLREHSYLDREGVSLRGIVEAAEKIGLRTLAIKVPLVGRNADEPGLMQAPFPTIVHWEQKHFVVVYKMDEKHVWVADPAFGKKKITHEIFKRSWIAEGDRGIALLLEPTPEFYAQEGEKINKTGFGFLLRYLKPYRKLAVQLLLGLLLGGAFQLAFPFLTQAVVDIGINTSDINFVYLILLAQLMLFLGQITVNVVQSWILLHIGTRINIHLISDFLIKLMRLPIGFFDAKLIGDLLQRINDHRRIEVLLTTSSLNVIFSLFNLLIFGFVLFLFSLQIFLIFFISSLLYIGYIFLFLRKRKAIDHERFIELSNNQSALIELIQGMQEIKLQRSERKRRWQWTNIQARLFRADVKSLTITQYQDTGAAFISQLKDILITFIAAKSVIDGQLTLGTMLAIQYIIGQLNGPLQQMITFIRNAQDAQISLERLGEIHNMEEEEQEEAASVDILPEEGDIVIENVSFRYNTLADYALKNINLTIPKGKVTAIVGTSGSGKTTLLKLLLGFYPTTEGQIKIGGVHLRNVSNDLWRQQCGAVMQDGFIFSDTIAWNIAESEDHIDRAKLLRAVQTANIQAFVESLPLGYNTKIGTRGNGLSQGQKQRLLIARAVYKNPSFLFFDEATNALDARNEKVIMENMNSFFKGRTVIVVAHRLSTVKDADQIVVLERGALIEQGSHTDLVAQKGAYYQLIKNQLELGQ